MDRDGFVYSAKLAEQFERYPDMVDEIKKVVSEGTELSVDERNLLSVAYKNNIGSRRSSWRICNALTQNEEKKGRNKDEEYNPTQRYCTILENELDAIVTDILQLITDKLLPTVKTPDSRVFYLKMMGDYYRYQAEYSADPKRSEAASKSNQAYKEATDLAVTELSTTHPIRLGLALNYSVFFYEILNRPDEACKLARGAFDGAIAHLDGLSEESYKDSTLIMQLLRDNLTLWASDNDGEDEATKPNEEKA